MINIKPFHIFSIIITILFLYLIINLFNLQIMQNKKYKQIAEKNFVRINVIKATRGQIYDQKYRPIAINEPSLNLYASLGKIKNRKKLSTFISKEFNFPENEIYDKLYKHRFLTHRDLLIIPNISKKSATIFSEKMNTFPELFFQIESTRHYTLKNHFTGYVSQINENEFNNLKEKGYMINDLIGKTGLEKTYEHVLRGENGYELLQVNASGKNLGFFKKGTNKTPQKGDDLILNIDLELQEFIHQSFPKNNKGSVVILDVQTGGILAYVSEPTYDPNIFLSKIKKTTWDSLINNEKNPMLDRNIQGTYPPGSIFKPISGALGIDLNLINPESIISNCTGGLQIGNRYFKCWNPSGHGKVNYRNSLKHSCDVFYYTLSMYYSLDQLHDYALSNFMEQKTGIDLPNERKGFFPTTKWYKKNYGEYISITGHKVNLSIGQGEILNTPLQMAAFYAAIADNGVWKTPHFLDKTLSVNSKKFKDIMKYEEKKLSMSKKSIIATQDGLYAAVNEKRGTAKVCKIPGMTVYGKTGSAENHLGQQTHAWFAGYASWEYPEIAIVVFLENGGHGGSVAAPYAAKILEFYQSSIKTSE